VGPAEPVAGHYRTTSTQCPVVPKPLATYPRNFATHSPRIPVSVPDELCGWPSS
jgi:hypothetical protein